MPIDRGIIDQQLQELGESSRWWQERELRDLPAVMHADERILAITRGKLGRLRFTKRTWLMVVTDQRLICLRAAHSGWRQLEVNSRHIERVSLRVGPFRGRVVVGTNARTYRLLVPRADAYRLNSVLSSAGGAARMYLPGSGPTHMVRRMVDHVLSLPAAAFNPELPSPPAPPRDTTALEQRVHALEDQIQQLQQQVDFLEELLRKYQSGGAALTP